jgi:hypothetical protein
MRQSTQNADVLNFGGAIMRLALAPLPGALLLAGSMRLPLGIDALMVDILLVPYVAIFCYAATVAFVIPIMAVWSSARRPGYVMAAIWGMLSAWCSAAIISSVRELARWEPMLGFGVAGCACGVFYARLARSAESTPPVNASL